MSCVFDSSHWQTWENNGCHSCGEVTGTIESPTDVGWGQKIQKQTNKQTGGYLIWGRFLEDAEPKGAP